MSRALTLGFEPLSHGWAHVVLAQGSVSVRLRVSETTADPIGMFVHAVASLTARSGTEDVRWDAELQAHTLTLSRYGDAADLRVHTRTLRGDTVLLLELSDSLEALVAATLGLVDGVDRAALAADFPRGRWPVAEIAQLRRVGGGPEDAPAER